MEVEENYGFWDLGCIVAILMTLLVIFILAIHGCAMPEGTWMVQVSPEGYYEIWYDGKVVDRINGPKTFYLEGPPQGSDDFPELRYGLPGQSPGDHDDYKFLHTDGVGIVVCSRYYSTCEKLK